MFAQIRLRLFCFFSYGAVRIPLPRGVNFSLFERKVTKEANERAARPPVWSGFCHESPVSSARTRVTRTVLLPKAAVRFRTLHGSLGAYIMPRLCASRVVPLSDYRFPQSMILSPEGGVEKVFSAPRFCVHFSFAKVCKNLLGREGDLCFSYGADWKPFGKRRNGWFFSYKSFRKPFDKRGNDALFS